MAEPTERPEHEAAFVAALVEEIDRTRSRTTSTGCLTTLFVAPALAVAAWFVLEGPAWLRLVLALLALPGTFVVGVVVATELDARTVRVRARRFDAIHPPDSPGRKAALRTLARLPESRGRDALARELRRRTPTADVEGA